jgi:hypothetical protein
MIELTFVQDGTTYNVIDGNIYREEQVLIDTLYDPLYHSKNYVMDNGILYQLDPSDPMVRYPVVREFREGFEQARNLPVM